jgi:6-bladed beta-propeller
MHQTERGRRFASSNDTLPCLPEVWRPRRRSAGDAQSLGIGALAVLRGSLRHLLLGLIAASAFPSCLLCQQAPAEHYSPLPSPVLTIGAEGNPDYEFTALGAAHRLASGDFVVADWQSPIIRIYSPDGRLLRRVGRKGSGPGEYQAIHDLFLAADTILAYDWHQRRLTRLLATGELLGTQLLQPGGGRPVDLVTRLSKGRWLVVTGHQPSWSHGHGVYRDTLEVGVLGPSGFGSIHWLPASYPGMTMFAYMPSEDKTRWVVGPLALAATTVVQAHGDTILIGDTGTPEIQRWTADGMRLPPLALPLPLQPDLSPLLNARRDEDLAAPGADRQRPYILASRAAQRVLPRYQDFLLASNGDLWFHLFSRTVADSTRYLLLDSRGRVRARITLPARSRVLSVEGDWVLSSIKNEDDVEALAVRRWVPP